MNPDLERLQPYPFERLHSLLQGCQPPSGLAQINLGIGEPRHPTPEPVRNALLSHIDGLSSYPATRGGVPLREAICRWITGRFSVPPALLDPGRHVIPVAGTREALFAIAQAVVDRQRDALVCMPNPFYQIYEGAALLAGAEARFLNCTRENGYLPDLDSVSTADWDRCQLLYICSPGNPSGAVLPREYVKRVLQLADQHDFIIAADECYSELYPDENNPPAGLLQVCAETGRDDFRRCLVFHSLSKRSNAPGLRSGFVAGDAAVLQQFLRYRTYHGCALPAHVQAASVAAWTDEQHVRENRSAYREKFDAVLEILGGVMDVRRPDAGFYLWPRTPLADTEFARALYAREHVRVLPGSYLSRQANGFNPGAGHIRMALVATVDECVDAAWRIHRLIKSL
ncbi:MAG: succinyldiaminopimelate transaminase [Aquisalimonadaceae bacterium]